MNMETKAAGTLWTQTLLPGFKAQLLVLGQQGFQKKISSKSSLYSAHCHDNCFY